MRVILTAKTLRKLLRYDPKTGSWTWLVQPNNRVLIGSRAGCKTARYLVIKINGKSYYSAVLAHLYMTGRWPKQEVDHRDTDSFNDSWKNIRGASRSQNCANRRMHKNNTSGYKGVTWHRQRRKWAAQIKIDGKHKHLGLFEAPELAATAYRKAARKLFGTFARVS